MPHLRPPTRPVVAALFACVAMCAAQAQPIPAGGGQWRPVEQGVADVGPLSTQGRLGRADIRVPMNFDRVYELERPSLFAGSATRTGVFARMQAGVIAVFDRSQYSYNGTSIQADVPAGTVYYIGGLPRSLTGARDSLRPLPANFVNRSARAQPLEQFQQPAPPAPSRRTPTARQAVATIWTDDAYRRARAAALLDECLRISSITPATSDR